MSCVAHLGQHAIPVEHCATRSRPVGTVMRRLGSRPKTQESAYLATAPDDFATRVIWTGEGVDLVHDIPSAAEIIERIMSQAAATLMEGLQLVRATDAP